MSENKPSIRLIVLHKHIYNLAKKDSLFHINHFLQKSHLTLGLQTKMTRIALLFLFTLSLCHARLNRLLYPVSASGAANLRLTYTTVDWFEASGPTDECILPKGLIINNAKGNGSEEEEENKLLRKKSLINVCDHVRRKMYKNRFNSLWKFYFLSKFGMVLAQNFFSKATFMPNNYLKH